MTEAEPSNRASPIDFQDPVFGPDGKTEFLDKPIADDA